MNNHATWKDSQKPFKGLHWWYRLLTGRRWTFPYINPQGHDLYWKHLIGGNRDVPCKLLNIGLRIKFFKDRTWSYVAREALAFLKRDSYRNNWLGKFKILIAFFYIKIAGTIK